MVRRPVAWVVAVVLLAEAFGVALLNWILGTLVGRQHMSLAGLDPDVMANSPSARSSRSWSRSAATARRASAASC